MIGGILFLSCLFVCLFVCLSVCLSVFMPPDRMIRGIFFVLSVCLSVCLFFFLLSDLTFVITFEPYEVKTSYLGHWHAYSTNDALSNDTKVNDLVTLNSTFALKIAFFGP